MADIVVNSQLPHPISRTAYLQYMVKGSDEKMSAADAEEHLRASERDQLLFVELQEAITLGRLDSSIPDTNLIAEKIKNGRVNAFAAQPGPVRIQAMDVGSLVDAQRNLTGADLKNLDLYINHIRSGLAIATNVKGESEVSFSGSWGNKMTSNFDEYVSWIGRAMTQGDA